MNITLTQSRSILEKFDDVVSDLKKAKPSSEEELGLVEEFYDLADALFVSNKNLAMQKVKTVIENSPEKSTVKGESTKLLSLLIGRSIKAANIQLKP